MHDFREECGTHLTAKEIHSSSIRFFNRAKHLPKLKNCWSIKSRKTQNDRQRLRRTYSTNTLREQHSQARRQVGTSRTVVVVLSLLFSRKTMYNKTSINFGFCDIRNNQDLGKCYQPKPNASADNTYLDLDYSGYHKNLIQ